ncbi:MAG: DUF362 domain-containing protein, partial [Clostridia bacterium]|nr:DUF362 domain-containing protein [Clostridia bacterium]
MNAFAPVSVVPCDGYEKDTVKSALQNLLSPLGGLSAFVKPGMTVVLKANLVSGMKPEKAATTNPVLLAVLTEEIVALGAKVLLGDSPGGLYNVAHVGHVYDLSGMKQVEDAGGELNRDFSQKQAEYPNAHVLKSFTYTAYLDRADLLIDVCKIKSHGMMKLSCAAKNMFGTVPGLIKPEYHYRFPDYRDFADMILDLDDYFHPALSIADGVIGMEGNGPTAGTPKRIGCLLASVSPHCLDLAASSLLGLTPSAVPTLERARAHGLIPENAGQLEVFGDLEAFRVPDFK